MSGIFEPWQVFGIVGMKQEGGQEEGQGGVSSCKDWNRFGYYSENCVHTGCHWKGLDKWRGHDLHKGWAGGKERRKDVKKIIPTSDQIFLA